LAGASLAALMPGPASKGVTDAIGGLGGPEEARTGGTGGALDPQRPGPHRGQHVSHVSPSRARPAETGVKERANSGDLGHDIRVSGSPFDAEGGAKAPD